MSYAHRIATALFAAALLRGQAPATPATPIQHVVILFQENVSFDHYFATYPNAANLDPGEPVFHAAQNTPSINGLTPALLAHNPNSAKPMRLPRSQSAICDQDHDYGDEQKAYNGGAANKFVETIGASTSPCNSYGAGKGIVMSYYDGNTVTALWNYAQNFAMSDNYFSTVFGPSTLGHLNLVSGQTHGAVVVNGQPPVMSGTLVGDVRPAYDDCVSSTSATISMSGQNIGDLLNQKGISWGWFAGGFKPTSRNGDGAAVCAGAHTVPNGIANPDYVSNHEPFQFYKSTANPHHLPPSAPEMIGQTDQANHQYDLSDFFTALSAGKLPAVSFLKAIAYQDGHALYSDPLDEQTYLVNTINAIAQSPFWDSTAIIVTYDDSDGWYDHVMPPIVNGSATPKDQLNGPGMCGASDETAYQGRCGYGTRLPLLVISPYARVNYVDHAITDQTSLLRFIEDNWNLGRIGDTSFDELAGSLLSMFNFNSETDALILDPSTGEPVSLSAVAGPKNVQTPSKQFQLDGTGSKGAAAYSWTLAPGSLSASILNAQTAMPSVIFGSGYGTYTFQLTITDAAGHTASDSVAVIYIGR